MVPKFNSLQKHVKTWKCKKVKFVWLASTSCLQNRNMPRMNGSSLLREKTQWHICWLGGMW